MGWFYIFVKTQFVFLGFRLKLKLFIAIVRVRAKCVLARKELLEELIRLVRALGSLFLEVEFQSLVREFLLGVGVGQGRGGYNKFFISDFIFFLVLFMFVSFEVVGILMYLQVIGGEGVFGMGEILFLGRGKMGDCLVVEVGQDGVMVEIFQLRKGEWGRDKYIFVVCCLRFSVILQVIYLGVFLFLLSFRYRVIFLGVSILF